MSTLYEQFKLRLESKNLARDLVQSTMKFHEAVRKYNEAMENIRRIAEEIAGCKLDSWSNYEIKNYLSMYLHEKTK